MRKCEMDNTEIKGKPILFMHSEIILNFFYPFSIVACSGCWGNIHWQVLLLSQNGLKTWVEANINENSNEFTSCLLNTKLIHLNETLLAHCEAAFSLVSEKINMHRVEIYFCKKLHAMQAHTGLARFLDCRCSSILKLVG